jgi:Asp-tRNA(Asn)/Glu-tRNA(Gln) amidotransferase A subunit family amidase
LSELVLPQPARRRERVRGDASYEAWRAYAFEYDHHRDELPPRLAELLDKAAAVTPEEYDAGRRVAKRARRILAEQMAEVDVLLTPSSPSAAPKGLDFLGTPSFNRLWTLMGTPCINVPGLWMPTECHSASRSSAGLRATVRCSRRHCLSSR